MEIWEPTIIPVFNELRGGEGSDGIRSGDIRDTPTKVLREETRLPCGTGGNINSISLDAFVSSRTIDAKPAIPIGSDGKDHPPKKARTNLMTSYSTNFPLLPFSLTLPIEQSTLPLSSQIAPWLSTSPLGYLCHATFPLALHIAHYSP
ncbi:hypothetical protein F2Q69_00035467 [Brassica cretica]|uniref:Uncharacterized protein n=1 Tax=Brassica cretica TaxID=69181 RepID=A0A8S9SH83_BRACR|nr:hypothetical protein F2Q69_00035467 [Brassica cretica]